MFMKELEEIEKVKKEADKLMMNKLKEIENDTFSYTSCGFSNIMAAVRLIGSLYI